MSGLKEKISEAISTHISLDDTYTYELTRVKTAFEVGTMSLEDFEEWTDENVDDLAKSIVDALQPQLNDDQKIVLEQLKINAGSNGSLTKAIHSLFNLLTISSNDLEKDGVEGLLKAKNALARLTRKQTAEVLAAFAQWGLEQEVNSDGIN